MSSAVLRIENEFLVQLILHYIIPSLSCLWYKYRTNMYYGINNNTQAIYT